MITPPYLFIAFTLGSALILYVVLKLLYKTKDNRCTKCNKESCNLVKQTVHYSHLKPDGSYNPTGGFQVEMLCEECQKNGFERI